jgi:hypothetical protein
MGNRVRISYYHIEHLIYIPVTSIIASYQYRSMAHGSSMFSICHECSMPLIDTPYIHIGNKPRMVHGKLLVVCVNQSCKNSVIHLENLHKSFSCIE